MQVLTIKTTEGGFPSYTRYMSDYTDSVVLVANTNQSYDLTNAIAAGAKFMIISATAGDFYARAGGTATIPSASTVTGAASELNPAAFDIETANMPSNATTIGFKSATTMTLTLAFYK